MESTFQTKRGGIIWLQLASSRGVDMRNSHTTTPLVNLTGVPNTRGYLFGGAHIQDYSILGSIKGDPNLGNYLRVMGCSKRGVGNLTVRVHL